MAGDSSSKKWWKELKPSRWNSGKPKRLENSQDGSITVSAVSSQSNVVLRPEIATVPTIAGTQESTDVSASLPATEPPASSNTILDTSVNATTEIPQNTSIVRVVEKLEAGLHSVFDSIRDDQPPRNAEIDIVAVHGLNFKGSGNHAQETWMKGDKLWPRDFLPACLPKPARVMLFAYNSSPALDATAIKLDDHARGLLHWLSLERQDAPQRPLVFICHSLGGLVVKQALVEAKLDESYKSIFEATRLLVFFATPHQGGKYASVGDIVAKIATTTLRKPRNDLLNALKQDSNEATRRFEQARHLFDSCLVVSFYEGESYGKMNIIVDKKSATLNLPGRLEKQVAMHADHSSICKFDSSDSPAGKLVLQTIAVEVKRALELPQTNTPFDKENQKCLRGLRVTDPRDDKTRIEEKKGGLLHDSYVWVLENHEFKQWHDNPGSRLLWIKGDPGKGKTMLLCGIINELSNSIGDVNIISFFFCEATDSRLNSATAVLRSLIYMLVDQQPTLILHIRKKYDQAGKQLFEDVNAWTALSDILASMLEDPSVQKSYLIVDALDECTTDRDQLLDLVIKMSLTYSCVKWIISSRNWPDIEERLNTATQKVRLSLELNERSISAAVSKYISFKVDQLAELKTYTGKTKDAVQHYLSSNANDTFLWVALVCQDLKKVPQRRVLDKLKAFPPGLDSLYRRMMDQIQRSEEAELCKQILTTVSTVYRPISLDELACFVKTLEDHLDDYESLREIIECCGSLLTLQGRVVYFVHQSAKDFLQHTIMSAQLLPFEVRALHYSIFSISLDVLSKTLQRDIYKLKHPGFPIDQVTEPELDPLARVQYSCVYWVDHLQECGPVWNARDLQDGGSVDIFLRRKYLQWIEALSLLKSVSKGIRSMITLEDLLQEHTSQLFNLVRDEHRFVQYFERAIENNPLQIYASALIFSPTCSLTRQQFQNEEPDWIMVKPIVDDDWSACQAALEGHTNTVSSVAWSPDGTRLASSGDNTVKIWDPATGQCQVTLECQTSWPHSVAWSPNGTWLALGTYDTTVWIWDPNTSGHTTLKGHSRAIMSVAWSTNERLASGSDDSTVKIWDLVTGQCQATLEGHDKSVESIAWSPDGTRLASGSEDSTIKIWDPATGQCQATLDGNSGPVYSVAWSTDGRLASGGRVSTINIWDPATGQCQATLEGHNHWVRSVAWSSDGRLASASEDSIVKIWDLPTGQCQSTLEGHTGPLYTISWSTDGRLASGGQDSIVKIWDPAISQHQATLDGHSSLVNSVAWSVDGQLASGGGDCTVKIWDPATGHCQATLEGHTNSIELVAWSPDGTRLASGSGDSTIKIWDPATGQCQATLDGHRGHVYSIAWSTDGRIASGDYSKVRIWELATGQCQTTLEGYSDHDDTVAYSLAWSPDLTRLAITLKHAMIKIYDLATGQCQVKLKDHRAPVTCVAWSTDGRLASGANDNTFRIWDPATGQCQATFKSPIASHLHFNQSTSRYLHTNLGIFDLHASATSIDLVENPQDNPVPLPQPVGYGFKQYDVWVSYKGEKMLWLPSESRPYSSDICRTGIAIGTSLGRVLAMRFSEEKIARLFSS